MKPHNVLLSLGSNLGDRPDHLREALRRLAGIGHLERLSDVYETEPVGFESQSDFLNMAAELHTPLSPENLLVRVLEIEEAMGRHRRKKWGPRIIDIDIILYDDLVLNQPGLTIPHPMYHERRFVLAPLSDIAPHRQCPLRKKDLASLLDDLNDPHRVRRFAGRPATSIAG